MIHVVFHEGAEVSETLTWKCEQEWGYWQNNQRVGFASPKIQ
jgi:hypothetical protein